MDVQIRLVVCQVVLTLDIIAVHMFPFGKVREDNVVLFYENAICAACT